MSSTSWSSDDHHYITIDIIRWCHHHQLIMAWWVIHHQMMLHVDNSSSDDELMIIWWSLVIYSHHIVIEVSPYDIKSCPQMVFLRSPNPKQRIWILSPAQESRGAFNKCIFWLFLQIVPPKYHVPTALFDPRKNAMYQNYQPGPPLFWVQMGVSKKNVLERGCAFRFPYVPKLSLGSFLGPPGILGFPENFWDLRTPTCHQVTLWDAMWIAIW